MIGLLLILIVVLFVVVVVVLVRMNNKIKKINTRTKDTNNLVVDIREATLTSIGETVGNVLERTHSIVSENFQLLDTLTQGDKKLADQIDERFLEVHNFIEKCHKADIKKIDKLRDELQVLRGRRTGG